MQRTHGIAATEMRGTRNACEKYAMPLHCRMKILIWKIGALGDVVMTTPLVRQLRRVSEQLDVTLRCGRDARGRRIGDLAVAAVVGNPRR